ncbi:MAG TPA: hypothetical protein VGH56_10165 [Solirubrobacteraceae bacterium]
MAGSDAGRARRPLEGSSRVLCLPGGLEQRRQLAVEVGELAQQLTDALTSAGYTSEQARSANVDQLAAGTRPAVDTLVSAPGGDVAEEQPRRSA